MIKTNYRNYSFWLETAEEELLARPSFKRSEDVDVAILGGGFSGLWTAYYLLKESPGLRVAILEKEIVGYGASGRNGGWCSSRFPVSARVLANRFGRDAARALILSMMASVDEVRNVCDEEQIDAHFFKGGILSLARGAHQVATIRSAYSAYETLGFGDEYRLLSPEEVAERIRVTNVCGGLFTPAGASVHPGRLVRGLARAVERRGGIIYEETDVLDFQEGSTRRLVMKGGELRAKKAIVLAGEAYLTRLSKTRRSLVPMYSLISITEPLTPEQWSQIGWQGRESVASNRYSVDYLTRTEDGRILFGSRGAPYIYGSKITDDQDQHAETHANIQQSLVSWFPMLKGIKFTHSWGGPVGMPRDWMPTVSFDKSTGTATTRGYTGQGVSTTNLAGRVLAGLIMEKPTECETLPFVQRKSPDWEPEPLRWLSIRYMQDAFLRLDAAAEGGKRRPIDASFAESLGKH